MTCDARKCILLAYPRNGTAVSFKGINTNCLPQMHALPINQLEHSAYLTTIIHGKFNWMGSHAQTIDLLLFQTDIRVNKLVAEYMTLF